MSIVSITHSHTIRVRSRKRKPFLCWSNPVPLWCGWPLPWRALWPNSSLCRLGCRHVIRQCSSSTTITSSSWNNPSILVQVSCVVVIRPQAWCLGGVVASVVSNATWTSRPDLDRPWFGRRRGGRGLVKGGSILVRSMEWGSNGMPLWLVMVWVVLIIWMWSSVIGS